MAPDVIGLAANPATELVIADHGGGIAALLFAVPVVAMLLALGALALRERRGQGGGEPGQT